MRLFKIQSSRVSLSLLVTLLLGLTSLLPSRSAAQTCTGTLQSSTQTVPLGATGGNVFPPVFSQYNPPAGYVLVSAVISTYITMSGTIDLTNGHPTEEFGVLTGASDLDEITLNGNT